MKGGNYGQFFLFSLFVVLITVFFEKKLNWKYMLILNMCLLGILLGIFYHIYFQKNSPPYWMTKVSTIEEVYDYAKKNNLEIGPIVKYDVSGLTFLNEYDVTLYGRIFIKGEKKLTIFFPDSYEEKFTNKVWKNNFLSSFFNITLRENFEYSKYPFDKNIIWIRLRCLKKDDNTIHIPDFKSKLSNNLILNDWIIEETFFSYFNSENCHELLFNISIKRKILTPLIENIIPFFILNLIFFLFFIVYKKNERHNLKYTVESASGLLFTILMSQINLRTTVDTPTIMYLDYFYLLNYAILIALVFFPLIDNKFKFNDKTLKLIQKFYWTGILEIIILITYFSFESFI